MCVGGGGGGVEWSVSHVVGSQEPDEAVVWFGRLSQVVRYQLIGWVKHLYSRRARGEVGQQDTSSGLTLAGQ